MKDLKTTLKEYINDVAEYNSALQRAYLEEVKDGTMTSTSPPMLKDPTFTDLIDWVHGINDWEGEDG